MPHASKVDRRLYWKKYYITHREERLARNAVYRAEHRDRLAALRRARRDAEPEVFRAYGARYRDLHRDEIKARRSERHTPAKPQPDMSRVEAPMRARWTIVADLGERDGIEYARCRCRRGHESVIAVDVRPAPDCTQCLSRRRQR